MASDGLPHQVHRAVRELPLGLTAQDVVSLMDTVDAVHTRVHTHE